MRAPLRRGPFSFFRSAATLIRPARRPAPVLLLGALALGVVACGGPEPAAPRPTLAPAAAAAADAPAQAAPAERPRTIGALEARAAKRPPVLFVGLDGADWQLMEPWIASGAMPNLARLRREGTWGELETETPPLSPLLWTTMMTGVSPLEHGVLDFSRFQPGTGEREPVTREEREVPAIWNAATWAGKKVAVFGLWATYPAEAVAGTLVSDRLFGFLNVEDSPPPGAVYPPADQERAVAELRAVWRETGLAEMRAYLPWLTDSEYAERAESERPYDHPVSALRRILIETRLYDRLFERAWRELAPDLAIVYLQGTDSIGHVFAPFAPPRQASVSVEDYGRYSKVPELYFRAIDELLGRYDALARAAGGTLVLASDHGFYWNEGRPDRLSSFANATAAKWHRKEGIYLIRGPGVAAGRGARVGVRQLFPTLLGLAGLPAAAGVEAKPLPGAPAPSAPPFDYLAPFRELRARAAPAPGPAAGAGGEEIAKLQALGYIGAGEPTRAPAAALASGSTKTAGAWNNTGIILRGERKDAEARAAFEKAIEIDPNLASALWNLSDLLFAENQLDRADELMLRAVDNGLPEGTKFLIGRAIGYQRAGTSQRSLALLDRAVAMRPEEREFWLFRGRYRVDARQCEGALDDFRHALELGADADPAAHASVAVAAICMGDRATAVAALRRSLALDPNQPRVRAMLAELSHGG